MGTDAGLRACADSFPEGVEAWSAEMAPAFAEASREELAAAAAATTFEDMNTRLPGLPPRGGCTSNRYAMRLVSFEAEEACGETFSRPVA